MSGVVLRELRELRKAPKENACFKRTRPTVCGLTKTRHIFMAARDRQSDSSEKKMTKPHLRLASTVLKSPFPLESKN